MLAGTYFRDLMTATNNAFHLMTDQSGILSDVLWREKMADVIGSMDTAKGLARHPMFLYFASQATHGPLVCAPVQEEFVRNRNGTNSRL